MMTLNTPQAVLLCSGFGQYHTDNPNSPAPKPYQAITYDGIAKMVGMPPKKDKKNAQWFIPSDALTREAQKQREQGRFYAVWCDFDQHTLQESIQTVLATLLCSHIIYSTSSATPEYQKWRVIIPLAAPSTANQFEQVAAIINDKFEAAGIVPDRASERCNQICYLPNQGEFYSFHIEATCPPLDWQHALADELAEKQRQAEQEQTAKNEQRERSRQNAITRMATDNLISPIDAYNGAYPIEQSLEFYGYKRVGKRYLSPNSHSGQAGVTIENGKWFSSHGSDSGIGKPCTNGGTMGDAFDLFTYYEHNGNRNAATKAAGNLFTIGGATITKHNQREYAKQQNHTGDGMDNKPKPPPNNDDTVTKTLSTPDWKKKLSAHVKKFNKTHAQVLIGGKHRIMRTVPASINHDRRESYEFLSQESLAKIYQNTAIKTGEKELKNGELKECFSDHLTAWAKHFDSLVYKGGVIFKPNGILPPEYYNTWQGFAVKPKQGASWAAIQHHIDEVICYGNPELITYFYNWVAYTLQRPENPAGAALVCRGEKGSGKGTIGHFLSKLWGNHSLHISNSNHLTGNFNGHLNDVCFLFADEAYYSGDKQHEGVLKALITEPTVTIERKGIDAVSQPNYLKVFMATNHDWAVPATKDERRYCVFDVSSEKIGDKDYFDSLHKDCNDTDIQAAFLYDMLNRDITGFHTGQIPDTDGLKAQRMQSLGSMGKWLVDSLNSGYFEKDDTTTLWQSLIPSKELYNSYLYWCDRQKITEYNRETQTALGKYLNNIGFESKKTTSCTMRTMGNIEEAIRKFEVYEKVKI